MVRDHAPWRDEALLREKYLGEKRTSREIADEWDCSKTTVVNWLREYDIPIRHQSDPEPWRDKETLERLYWDEGKSSIEIADELGCSKVCVLEWMERNGVGRRMENKDKPAPVYKVTNGYLVASSRNGEGSDRVFIHKLVAVAEYGFDAVRDKVVHHENGIKWDNRPENLTPMTRSEHNSIHAENSDAPWRDKELLVSMLEKYNQTELADKWGCNQSMISRWRKRHGLRD